MHRESVILVIDDTVFVSKGFETKTSGWVSSGQARSIRDLLHVRPGQSAIGPGFGKNGPWVPSFLINTHFLTKISNRRGHLIEKLSLAIFFMLPIVLDLYRSCTCAWVGGCTKKRDATKALLMHGETPRFLFLFHPDVCLWTPATRTKEFVKSWPCGKMILTPTPPLNCDCRWDGVHVSVDTAHPPVQPHSLNKSCSENRPTRTLVQCVNWRVNDSQGQCGLHVKLLGYKLMNFARARPP